MPPEPASKGSWFEIVTKRGALQGVIILSDEEGRPLGEALVELASEHAQQQAVQSRHKATMGGRYVELYASSKAVFDQVQLEAPHVPKWP